MDDLLVAARHAQAAAIYLDPQDSESDDDDDNDNEVDVDADEIELDEMEEEEEKEKEAGDIRRENPKAAGVAATTSTGPSDDEGSTDDDSSNADDDDDESSVDLEKELARMTATDPAGNDGEEDVEEEEGLGDDDDEGNAGCASVAAPPRTRHEIIDDDDNDDVKNPFDSCQGAIGGSSSPSFRWPYPVPIRGNNRGTHPFRPGGIVCRQFVTSGGVGGGGDGRNGSEKTESPVVIVLLVQADPTAGLLQEGNLLWFLTHKEDHAAGGGGSDDDDDNGKNINDEKTTMMMVALGIVTEVFGPVRQPLYKVRVRGRMMPPPPILSSSSRNEGEKLGQANLSSEAHNGKDSGVDDGGDGQAERHAAQMDAGGATRVLGSATSGPLSAESLPPLGGVPPTTFSSSAPLLLSSSTGPPPQPPPKGKIDDETAAEDHRALPLDPSGSGKKGLAAAMEAGSRGLFSASLLETLVTERATLYYRADMAAILDPLAVMRQSGRGCDASNQWDEEVVDSSYMDYSDDEQEQRARRGHRHRPNHLDDGHRRQPNERRNSSTDRRQHQDQQQQQNLSRSRLSKPPRAGHEETGLERRDDRRFNHPVPANASHTYNPPGPIIHSQTSSALLFPHAPQSSAPPPYQSHNYPHVGSTHTGFYYPSAIPSSSSSTVTYPSGMHLSTAHAATFHPSSLYPLPYNASLTGAYAGPMQPSPPQAEEESDTIYYDYS
jgi:hypothetical protein